jgi:quinol monooxygenase YgiN
MTRLYTFSSFPDQSLFQANQSTYQLVRFVTFGIRLPGTKLEGIITDSLNFFDNRWKENLPHYTNACRVCLVFIDRRVLVIIVRITINALLEKQTEVVQTLLSMLEPTEMERGCLNCRGFRDIEDKNGFSLIAAWETREDLDHYIKSDRFSVLLGTKSLLCEPPQIEIHTVSHSEGMETVNAARRKTT